MKIAAKNWNPGLKTWLALGGLAALGLTILAIQVPSICRELRLMRM